MCKALHGLAIESKSHNDGLWKDLRAFSERSGLPMVCHVNFGRSPFIAVHICVRVPGAVSLIFDRAALVVWAFTP
jgi:hypothetical protein